MSKPKPKALAVFNDPADFPKGRAAMPKTALEAYQLLLDGKFARLNRFCVPPLPIHSDDIDMELNLGDPLTCYSTTEYCVEQFGGSIQYGWQVIEMQEYAWTGNNEFVHLEIGAHAIWVSPSGEQMEVIDYDRRIAMRGSFKRIVGFLPHERIRRACRATINFLDNYGDGNRILLAEQCDLRQVRV